MDLFVRHPSAGRTRASNCWKGIFAISGQHRTYATNQRRAAKKIYYRKVKCIWMAFKWMCVRACGLRLMFWTFSITRVSYMLCGQLPMCTHIRSPIFLYHNNTLSIMIIICFFSFFHSFFLPFWCMAIRLYDWVVFGLLVTICVTATSPLAPLTTGFEHGVANWNRLGYHLICACVMCGEWWNCGKLCGAPLCLTHATTAEGSIEWRSVPKPILCGFSSSQHILFY